MYRSSIFNFESFEGFRPSLPKTLLFVLAVLALLELSVRLVPEIALMPGKSRRGEMNFVEKNVLPKLGKIDVVVLGSSRMRRAVVPKQLDDALGIPVGSTLNSGLASGSLFEALYFYERNEERLKNARVVLLGIDEWHLSTGWKIGSTYEIHAPYSERFAMPERIRTQMVLDGVLQIRQKLKLLPRGLLVLTGLKKQDEPDLIFDENNHVLPRRRRGVPSDVDARAYHETIDNFYTNFEISPVFTGHIERLATRVKANGGTLVLMQLPNRAAYQREMERMKGAEYHLHLAALQSVAHSVGAPLYVYDSPQQLGLTDADYEDYGHMNDAGARIFTAKLAQLLTAEKRLPERLP